MHEGEVVAVLTRFISKTQRVLIKFGIGNVRGPFERPADRRQRAAVTQREGQLHLPSGFVSTADKPDEHCTGNESLQSIIIAN
jgi:hypothetical protein